jgi:uncharacterized protein (TIGR04255 family)
MGKIYENSPLIEVSCEFNFKRDGSWNAAIPGFIYSDADLKEKFPLVNPSRPLHEKFRIRDRAHQGSPDIRVYFQNEDNNAIVQVEPYYIVITHLKPYSNWDNFYPLLKTGYSAYLNATTSQNIERVNLRYINQIEINENNIDIDEYFNIKPSYSSELGDINTGFFVGVKTPGEDNNNSLQIFFTPLLLGDETKSNYILDISYYNNSPLIVEEFDIEEWSQNAHRHINKAFEACITEKLRVIFREVA